MKKNFRLDISGIIRREFANFMRENPDWYDGVDWDYWAAPYRFLLQSNRAALKIEEYLNDN